MSANKKLYGPLHTIFHPNAVTCLNSLTHHTSNDTSYGHYMCAYTACIEQNQTDIRINKIANCI